SFTASALNNRIPSASFSVAMASSLSRHRNDFSSSEMRSIGLEAAASGPSLRSTGPMVDFNSLSNGGLMVSRSQPANSRISPLFQKPAPIPSVEYPNFL